MLRLRQFGQFADTLMLTREAIALSVDSNSWLTLAAPSTSGACLNSSQQVPVTFGVDMRTGCMIRCGNILGAVLAVLSPTKISVSVESNNFYEPRLHSVGFILE